MVWYIVSWQWFLAAQNTPTAKSGTDITDHLMRKMSTTIWAYIEYVSLFEILNAADDLYALPQ